MASAQHGRLILARIVFAAAGFGVLVAVAACAQLAAALVGGARGTVAGLVVIAAVFGGCGLAFRPRSRGTRLQRPAPVRFPVRPGLA